ncbi:MAG: hypothetical protein NTX76_00285, partial [Alphaproteobacteria bacterium]|nr:hypothetical protein [Alphaproteobacteria bacterium]
ASGKKIMGQFIKKYVCCLLVGGILNSTVMGSLAQAMDCLPTDCFTRAQHRPRINQIVPFTPSPVVDQGNDQPLSQSVGSTPPHVDEVRLEILPKPTRIGFARSSVSALHDQHGITQDKLDEFSKYWEAFSEVDDATKKSISDQWRHLAFAGGVALWATAGYCASLELYYGPLLGLQNSLPTNVRSLTEKLFVAGTALASYSILFIPFVGQLNSVAKNIFSLRSFLGLSSDENNRWPYKLLRAGIVSSALMAGVVPASYKNLQYYYQLKDLPNPLVNTALNAVFTFSIAYQRTCIYRDMLYDRAQQKLNERLWENAYVAGLRTTLSWDIGNAITSFHSLSDSDKKDFHHRIFGASQESINPQENTFEDLENLYRIVYFSRQHNPIHPNQEEPSLRKAARHVSHAFSLIIGAVEAKLLYDSSEGLLSGHTALSDQWTTSLSVGASLAYGFVKKSIYRTLITKNLTDLYDWYFGYKPQEVDFNDNHHSTNLLTRGFNYLGGLLMGGRANNFSEFSQFPSALQIPSMVVVGAGNGLFWYSILNKWQPVGINKIKELCYKTDCLKPYMGSPDEDISFMTYQVIDYMTKIGKSVGSMPDELIQTHFGLIQTYMDKKEEAAEAAEVAVANNTIS